MFIAPMLCTTLRDPNRPGDPRYVAEPKFDGPRAHVHIAGGRTPTTTPDRSGQSTLPPAEVSAYHPEVLARRSDGGYLDGHSGEKDPSRRFKVVPDCHDRRPGDCVAPDARLVEGPPHCREAELRRRVPKQSPRPRPKPRRRPSTREADRDRLMSGLNTRGRAQRPLNLIPKDGPFIRASSPISRTRARQSTF